MTKSRRKIAKLLPASDAAPLDRSLSLSLSLARHYVRLPGARSPRRRSARRLLGNGEGRKVRRASEKVSAAK